MGRGDGEYKILLEERKQKPSDPFLAQGFVGRSEMLRKWKVPHSCTGHFGALSLEALETPSYLDSSSTGAMHKGCRPPGTPAISSVLLSNGALERWGQVAVDGALSCSLASPGLYIPRRGMRRRGCLDWGSGQDCETGGSRVVAYTSLLKASCRELHSAVSRMGSRAV